MARGSRQLSQDPYSDAWKWFVEKSRVQMPRTAEKGVTEKDVTGTHIIEV